MHLLLNSHVYTSRGNNGQDKAEDNKIMLTLVSAGCGDRGIILLDFLASSSDEQSEHKKCSSFFACSIVMPMHAGWNLGGND